RALIDESERSRGGSVLRRNEADAASIGRAIVIEPAQSKTRGVVTQIPGSRNLAVSRKEIRPRIVFAGRGNGYFPIQPGDAALKVDLTHMRVCIGCIAVEGMKFRAFIGFFTRAGNEYEIHNPG